MSGKKRKKPEIFIKFVEVKGRLVPLIGGASDDGQTDGTQQSDAPPPSPSSTGGDNPPPSNGGSVDIEAIVQEKLDSYAKDFGFEDWDDMQSKLLEQQGKTQEYIDKLRENYNKQLTQVSKERDEYKERYEKSVIKNQILTVASQLSVDPELVYELLSKKAVVQEDESVLIDGKGVKEAVEEFLSQRPHLAKPTGTGSGATNTSQGEPEPASYEELLKDPIKLKEFKEKNPERYRELKEAYFAEKLRR